MDGIAIASVVAATPPQTSADVGGEAPVLHESWTEFGMLGMNFRDPFLDRRLVDFCLALPVDQKLRQGRGRLVMRLAMAGGLPPHVPACPGKADLDGGVACLIAARHRQRFDAMLEAAGPATTPFVDPDALRRLSRRGRVAGAPRDAGLTLRVATPGAWLSRTGGSPPTKEDP